MTRQTYNIEVTHLTLKFPQKVKRKGYKDARLQSILSGQSTTTNFSGRCAMDTSTAM